MAGSVTDHGWTISPPPPVNLVTGATFNVTSPGSTPTDDYVKLEAFIGPITNVIGATIDDTAFVAVDGYRIFPGGASTIAFSPHPAVTGITHWILAGAPSGFAKVLAIFVADPGVIPPLRQKQRDDGGRQFPRNGPTSIQASARQGPRGTYL